MKHPFYLFMCCSLVFVSAHAATWFEVEDPSSDGAVKVEVDLDSLRSYGDVRELVAYIRYDPPRRYGEHEYVSVMASLEIACETGRAVWKRLSFYHPRGTTNKLVIPESLGTAGQPDSTLNLLPQKIINILQRSACKPTTQSKP